MKTAILDAKGALVPIEEISGKKNKKRLKKTSKVKSSFAEILGVSNNIAIKNTIIGRASKVV